jgi:hypothetical protein
VATATDLAYLASRVFLAGPYAAETDLAVAARVDPERWAISAMVNWRASYIRWALSISVGVIFGLRPPVRPRTRAAASPAWVRSLMSAASYSAITETRAARGVAWC